jgi:hypothetical protein
MIGYHLMYGNNSGNAPLSGFSIAGPGNQTTDEAKKIRANLYFVALNGALTVGAYTDYINYGNVPYKGSHTVFQKAIQTVKGYAAYNSKWFGIGVEYFMQTQKNGEVHVVTATPTSNDTSAATQSGLSVFAHATIIQNKLNFFARFDMYNPDTKYQFVTTGSPAKVSETYTSLLVPTNTYKENFLTAGLDWTPTADKKVHIEPNVWYDAISNAFGSDNLKADDYFLYRVTFYYIFK